MEGALLQASSDHDDDDEQELYNSAHRNDRRNGDIGLLKRSSERSRFKKQMPSNADRSSPKLLNLPLVGVLERKLPKSGRLYRTFLLFSAFLGLGLCIALPGPTLLDLETRTQSTTDQMSYLFAGRSVGYLSGSLLGGVLFDRLNKMLLLGVSLLLTGAATLVFPWASTLLLAIVLIGFQGLSMGMLDTGGNALCMQLWGRASPPYLQGLHFAFGVGAFIAPLIAEPFLTVTTHVIATPNFNVPIELNGTIPSPIIQRRRRAVTGLFEDSIFATKGDDSGLQLLGDDASGDSNVVRKPSLMTDKVVLQGAFDDKTSSTTTTAIILNAVSISMESADSVINTTTTISLTTSPVAIKSDLTVAANDSISSNSVSEIVNATVASTSTTTTASPSTTAASDGTTLRHKPSSNNGQLLPDQSPQSADSSKNAVVIIQDTIQHGSVDVVVNNVPVVPAGDSTSSSTSTTTTTTTATTTPNVNATGEWNSTVSSNDTYSATTESPQVELVTLSSATTYSSSTIPVTAATEVIAVMTTSTTTPASTSSTSSSVSTTNLIIPIKADPENRDVSASSIATSSTVSSSPSPPPTAAVTMSSSSSSSSSSSAAAAATTTTTTTTAGTTATVVVTTSSTTLPPDLPIISEKVGVSRVHIAYMIVAIILTIIACFTILLGLSDRFKVPCSDRMALIESQSEYRPSAFSQQSLTEIKPADDSRTSSHSSGMCPSGFHIQLLVLLFIFYLLYVGAEVSFGQFISAYAEKAQHWSRSEAAYLASAFWGALAAGRGVAIPLTRRLRPASMIAIDLILLTVSMFGMLMGVQSSDTALWLCSAIAGFGMSSIFASGFSWVERYIPVTGKISSVLISGAAIGEMIIPVLAGFFFVRNPQSLAYLMSALSILLVVLFVLLQNLALNGQDGMYSYSRTNSEKHFSFSNREDDEEPDGLVEPRRREAVRLLPMNNFKESSPAASSDLTRRSDTGSSASGGSSGHIEEARTKTALFDIFDESAEKMTTKSNKIAHHGSAVLAGDDDSDNDNFYDAFPVQTDGGSGNKMNANSEISLFDRRSRNQVAASSKSRNKDLDLLI